MNFISKFFLRASCLHMNSRLLKSYYETKIIGNYEVNFVFYENICPRCECIWKEKNISDTKEMKVTDKTITGTLPAKEIN